MIVVIMDRVIADGRVIFAIRQFVEVIEVRTELDALGMGLVEDESHVIDLLLLIEGCPHRCCKGLLR